INQQYRSFASPRRADHLILAGDIGRLADYDKYRDFLQKQTDTFKIVFLVLGNHEFYNISVSNGLQRARQLEHEPCLSGRLVALHRGRFDIPSSCVTVLGCTLWSHVPDDSRDIVRSKIQDVHKIHDWTVDDHTAAHEEDLTWLLGEIESIQEENNATCKQAEKRVILVVTHHTPSLTGASSPQHENNPWKYAFGTDVLERMPKLAGVRAWVFGHTHYTTEFKRRGIRVVSDQPGYGLPWSERNREDGFDAGKVIHV
ncbi:Metallo-dependent phosphatase-like protein, partial [Aspergillus aurantiobrunneus]